MNLSELLAHANRLQQGRRFKIVASAAIALITIGIFAAFLVAANEPGAADRIAERASERAQALRAGIAEVERTGPIEALQGLGRTILTTLVNDPGARAVAQLGLAFALVGGVFAALVWLGIGLSSIGLLLVSWGVAWPLMLFEPTSALGGLLFASSPLVLAFITGLQLLRAALSGSNPVTAVARNVLSEAVRMKVSLVFIVLLIMLLAVVPSVLNEAQPLRYRVQQWMQYGIGFAYLLMSMMTVFLSVATVTTEQREKIIWQTMTKPTAPWQYILGKWVGVMSVNAALLAVSAAGVYMFTEYLRHQPAEGEVAYMVRADGQQGMTLDRRILETQVLVARVGVQPEPFEPTEDRIRWAAERRADIRFRNDPSLTAADRSQVVREEREAFLNAFYSPIEDVIERRILAQSTSNSDIRDVPRVRRFAREEVMKEFDAQSRTIEPATSRTFLFFNVNPSERLSTAEFEDILRTVEEMRERGERPTFQVGREYLTLRYKINSASNTPTDIYTIGVFINGTPWPATQDPMTAGRNQSALNVSQILTFPVEMVPPDGVLQINISNPPINPAPQDPRSITIPPDGLEIMYAAGGYELNFWRIMLIIWIKLGFIAAVGVATGTFMSFPTASFATIAVLFAAESAGFLSESLQFHYTVDDDGNRDYFNMAIRLIALPISVGFKQFAELEPATKLVEGRLVSWNDVLLALGVVGSWTIGTLSLGWAVFRKRELAIYSGN